MSTHAPRCLGSLPDEQTEGAEAGPLGEGAQDFDGGCFVHLSRMTDAGKQGSRRGVERASSLSVFSDWGCWRQAVPLASNRSRRSLASLRGRRVAAAGWGQESEVSQSVPRPGGIAAIRFWTLNEITAPIVPTGTTRLRPSQTETGPPLIMRLRPVRRPACPSGIRCRRPTYGAR
jgi:hypothetical protein